MTALERTTSFARDIRPLFRQIDIDHMSDSFDLSRYEDVRDNAHKILDRLTDVSPQRRMPPNRSGGPWNADKIAMFKKWIDDGLLA
jgi:hypothetical protein